MQFYHGENTFSLLPEKALFWENHKCLVVSDLHIGKISHFRKSGIAVPAKGAGENLRILNALLERFQPEMLIFTGDLFHSDENREWDEFFSWRASFPGLKMVLVRGNHDLIDLEKASGNHIHIVENEMYIDDVVLGHCPRSFIIEDQLNIAGHIHPVVRLRRPGLDSMRVACFLIKPGQIILPAFGYFTGGYVVEPGKDEQVIIAIHGELIPYSLPGKSLPISKK
jgi:uncharacterized protein